VRRLSHALEHRHTGASAVHAALHHHHHSL
jgi:hypothetical protein